MNKTQEQKKFENAKEEIKRLKEDIRNAEDEALKIKLGQINKAAGFPDNTLGV